MTITITAKGTNNDGKVEVQNVMVVERLFSGNPKRNYMNRNARKFIKESLRKNQTINIERKFSQSKICPHCKQDTEKYGPCPCIDPSEA